MQRNHLLSCCLALGAILPAACSNDNRPSASIAPVPVPQTLDTQQVLTLAAKPSETASPFMVNGGLISFSDTSETSSPVAVNGM